MKLLTVGDLLLLEYGDKVYHRQKKSNTTITFRYVGRMPSSETYLIFSQGEVLKQLYISRDNTFEGEWYRGDFDDNFIIKIRIKELEDELFYLNSKLKEDNTNYNKLLKDINKEGQNFIKEKEVIINENEYNKMLELGSNTIKFDKNNGIGVSIKCLLKNGDWQDITDYSKW